MKRIMTLILACMLAAAMAGCGGERSRTAVPQVSPVPKTVVYVSGFVVRPGTYQVPMGTTVAEVIRRAGGFAAEADGSRVNQNEVVAAAMEVYVPKRGEPTEVNPSPAAPPAEQGSPPLYYTGQPAATASPARVIRVNHGASASDDEREMLEMVNEERVSRGVAPLVMDSLLVRAARLKSEDMNDNNYFAHESPTYGTVTALLNRCGAVYHYAGENLARTGTVAQAHRGLMDSPGHRANILNQSFRRIGIGIVKSRGGVFVTQEFTD